MIRQSGFYWVKIKEYIGTNWEELTIGKYSQDGDYWEIVRSDEDFYDSELVVLSDRLEEPNE